MRMRIKQQQQWMLFGLATAVITAGGCRSSMPQWNLFGFRNRPSAETLAGNGPTTTYPPPPSETATPTAIASVAGGTANRGSSDPITGPSNNPVMQAGNSSQLASSAAAKSPAVNMAAAQANGYNFATNSAPNATSKAAAASKAAAPSAYAVSSEANGNSAVPALPAGYRFGDQGTPPNIPSTSTAAASPSAGPVPGMTNQVPAATDPLKAAGSKAAMAYPGSGKTAVGALSAVPTPSSRNKPSSGGFSLPAGTPNASKTIASGFQLPSSAPLSAASTAPSNAQPFTPKSNSAADAGSKPAYSTANKATAPTTGSSLDEATQSNLPSGASGYAPGSTSKAGQYPTTSGYPNTGTPGSFYR
jgi:hypothetical protein